MFNLSITYAGAALNADTAAYEVADLLRNAAQAITDGETSGNLLDSNGRHLGTWDYTPPAHTVELWGMTYALGAHPVEPMIITRDVMLYALGQSNVETDAHSWDDHTRSAYSIDRPADGYTITAEFDTDTDGNVTGWTATLFDDDGEDIDTTGGTIQPETAETDLESMATQIQAWLDPVE